MRYLKSRSLWLTFVAIGFWCCMMIYIAYRNLGYIDELILNQERDLFVSNGVFLINIGVYGILGFLPVILCFTIILHVSDFYTNRGYINLQMVSPRREKPVLADALVLVLFSGMLTAILIFFRHYFIFTETSAKIITTTSDIIGGYVLFFLYTLRQLLIPMTLAYIFRKRTVSFISYAIVFVVGAAVTEYSFLWPVLSMYVLSFSFNMADIGGWLKLVLSALDCVILLAVSIVASFRKIEEFK